MRQTLTGLTVSIDGGAPQKCELTRWQDVEYVRWARAVKPDLLWSTTDDAGHRHAYAPDGTLPTLRIELVRVDCTGGCGDDYCEGYDAIEYHCTVCGQVVEPGTVPDIEVRTTGVPITGPVDWSLRAWAAAPLNVAVPVVIDGGDGHTWTGRAMAVGVERTHDGDMIMEMVSASPLTDAAKPAR